MASALPGRRIGDIEFLRGVAIVFVLIFHAPHTLFPWAMPRWDHITENYLSFWPGVDLFFAISGFVIARSLLPILQGCAGMPAFAQAVLVFWLRRAWRLLPSSWLWLGIMLLGSILFNRTGAFDTVHVNFESTIAGLLSLANFRFADAFGHYGYGASAQYWSLSLEEQFYLLLPILVLIGRRRLTLTLLALVFGMFLLPQTALIMCLRVHAILLGVLLAIFAAQPVHALFEPVFLHRRPLLGLGVVMVLLGLIASLAVFTQHIVPAHNLDVIAVLAAMLVFIAAYDRDYLCPYPWLQRPMGWLGSRSYALYLTHVFVFIITREIWFRAAPAGTVFGPTYTLRFGVTALVLLVTLSEVNYRLVERPLRRYGQAVAARLAARPV